MQADKLDLLGYKPFWLYQGWSRHWFTCILVYVNSMMFVIVSAPDHPAVIGLLLSVWLIAQIEGLKNVRIIHGTKRLLVLPVLLEALALILYPLWLFALHGPYLYLLAMQIGLLAAAGVIVLKDERTIIRVPAPRFGLEALAITCFMVAYLLLLPINRGLPPPVAVAVIHLGLLSFTSLRNMRVKVEALDETRTDGICIGILFIRFRDGVGWTKSTFQNLQMRAIIVYNSALWQNNY